MQSIDESMRFVELAAQPGDPAPGDDSSATLHPLCAAFRRFHLLRDVVDVSVQRVQQFSRLRGVGVVAHSGIIALTAAMRATTAAQQTA
jgi:hypothetical protein